MVYRQQNATLNTSSMSGQKRKHNDDADVIPNHILLFTVLNPIYPITVEVFSKICSPIGQVLRIVIFKKNGVQAMVEFDSVDTAIAAKDSLNGADIYSDCCTLKIEYAKPERLIVHKNDSLTWDFTVAHNYNEAAKSKPLLQKPPTPGRVSVPPGYDMGPPPPKFPLLNSNRNQYDDGYEEKARSYNNFPHVHDGRRNMRAQSPPAGFYDVENNYDMSPYHQPMGNSVLMVYGLDPNKANPDKVFNLMCLYGNVLRIKFLKTKEGTAMVQMGDSVSAERCLQNLNNTFCSNFGGENTSDGDFKIQLSISKQQYLSEVTNPYPLPDKSPSFKDFSRNKNNRFLTRNASIKNRIQQPCKIIHFFNTPPNVSDSELHQVFNDYGVKAPIRIQKIPSRSEKSSSGFMEFTCLADAVAAIVSCNHAAIQSSASKFPFILKLCFSSYKSSIPNGKIKSDENNVIKVE